MCHGNLHEYIPILRVLFLLCLLQLEELPKARERIISLKQKNENLEAVLQMKQDFERCVQQ